MGFWKQLITRNKQPSSIQIVDPVNWQQWLQDDGYTRLSEVPEVVSAVNVIADLISNMSLHLMKHTDKGEFRQDNQLAHLIDQHPAAHMTRKQWMSKIVRDLYLYGDGNSICRIIVQPGTSYLSELKPVDMSNVSYMYDANADHIKIRIGGQEFDESQLLHVLINPDSRWYWVGTGYQQILQDILADLYHAGQTRKTFFSGRYMPNLIMKIDSDAIDVTDPKDRDAIIKRYMSTSAAMQPMIVPAEEIEVQQIKPLSLKDLAINESLEVDKKTIAGIFGVPPFLLGVGKFDKEEFNNFINTRIAGLGQVIAQSMTRDLLFSDDLYFRFNPRSLYQYNLSELVSAGSAMVDRIAMGRNEWRDWLGLEPRDDMDELLALENYVPSTRLGDQKKLKGGDQNTNESQTEDISDTNS